MVIPEENQTTIAISRKNHQILSKLGEKGQSFDDVLTALLNNQTTEYTQKNKDFGQSKFRVGRSEALTAKVPNTQTALESDSDRG
jgi:hypothetical protein